MNRIYSGASNAQIIDAIRAGVSRHHDSFGVEIIMAKVSDWAKRDDDDARIESLKDEVAELESKLEDVRLAAN